MAGLLSAIGGTLAGMGQGLTQQAEEDGKAKREARLAELQHGYRMTESKAQNDFTAGQNDLNRQQQTRENQLTRENTLENTRLQGANQLANTAAQGANTQANTRLSDELLTKRADTAYGRETEAATTKYGREVEMEGIRSGNRIKEDRAKVDNKGFSLGANDDKLLSDLHGQYYDSEYDPKDPAIEDKIAARLEGMGRRDLASYVRGRWESLPIPTDLQPSAPSVNGAGQSRGQPRLGSPAAAQPGTPASDKSAAPRPPQAGNVLSGYRFKGGNPKDPNNWEPAR